MSSASILNLVILFVKFLHDLQILYFPFLIFFELLQKFPTDFSYFSTFLVLFSARNEHLLTQHSTKNIFVHILLQHPQVVISIAYDLVHFVEVCLLCLLNYFLGSRILFFEILIDLIYDEVLQIELNIPLIESLLLSLVGHQSFHWFLQYLLRTILMQVFPYFGLHILFLNLRYYLLNQLDGVVLVDIVPLIVAVIVVLNFLLVEVGPEVNHTP
mmetsp:Transcript_2390/g.3249  ORF Transcript_2390/g.3249 Transcript_2390/m.3249 type:complete len:214 (-) Transcript_2390:288-929(-)